MFAFSDILHTQKKQTNNANKLSRMRSTHWKSSLKMEIMSVAMFVSSLIFASIFVIILLKGAKHL